MEESGPNVYPFDLVKQAEDCYERHLYYLRNLPLKMVR
jgi:hypothetical protein